MSADLADIRERLARVEEKQNALGDTVRGGFEKLDRKLDGFDERIRSQEVKSGIYGSVAGGVISLGIAFISAKLKGTA